MYRLTARAVADLDAIADYSLQQWGALRTESYIKALFDRFDWLAADPLLGRSRQEVGDGFRSYRQGSHIIFYTVADADIHIIGVPHAAMDFDAHFG